MIFQKRAKKKINANFHIDNEPVEIVQNYTYLIIVNCHAFKDFHFNVLAPQIINKRSENFIYFLTIDFTRCYQNYYYHYYIIILLYIYF